MNKYDWVYKPFNSINWVSHDKSIRGHRYNQHRFIKRFIHHQLPVVRIQYTTQYRRSYCDIPNNCLIAHDEFLKCTSLWDENKDWMEKSREALVKKITTPNLRDAIIDRDYNYNELRLHDSMHEEISNDNLRYESSSVSDDSNTKQRYQRKILE